MSKIFEALRKSKGDLAEVAKSIVDETGFEFVDEDLEQPLAVMRSPDQMVGYEEFDVGALSQVPTFQAQMRGRVPLLPFSGDHSQAAEQYRIIRTKVLQHESKPRLIVVSSPESGDGKSVTAVNTAGVFALNPEHAVLLVDGDLHRGSLARYFDLPTSPGLAEVLDESASLTDCVGRIDPYPNLFFLPGGKSQYGPADLLNSKRWSLVAESLRRQFHYVIIDTPPAGAVADFDLIQANADGVVLVVRQDHTNRLLFLRAYQSVTPEKLLGVVMNCVKPWFLGRSVGYYQYYHYSKYYRR